MSPPSSASRAKLAAINDALGETDTVFLLNESKNAEGVD